MGIEVLYALPLWLVLLLTLATLGLAIEIGFRAGIKARARSIDESLLSLIPSSLLGLLALLLGFSFSMSVARFDARKKAVLDEVDAFGTAWLRAGLLLDDRATVEARLILKELLSHRVDLPSWVLPKDERAAYFAKDRELQNRLWQLSEKVNRADRSNQVLLFASALNDVFDRSTDRWFHHQDHVPEVAYVVILIVAMASLGSLAVLYGYRRQTRIAPYILAALLALVLVLIEDIDRPARGFVRVDTSLMRETLKSFVEP